jgi:uncharacterized protein (DUF1330 family)
MSKGYWVVHVDVTDLEQFKTYLVANQTAFDLFGAKRLVRAGRFEVLEGTSRSRQALIEFPSYQAALDCWHSPEYQAALRLRQPVSTMDLVILEGTDP